MIEKNLYPFLIDILGKKPQYHLKRSHYNQETLHFDKLDRNVSFFSDMAGFQKKKT